MFLRLPAAEAFTVSPGKVELVLSAGEDHTGSFRLGNPGDEAVRLKVSVNDLSYVQGAGQESGSEVSGLDWIRFDPQELDLAPYHTGSVDYTIQLPADAAGEYACMIYFSTVAERPEGGISIKGRIGNALYVIVEGTEVVKGAISDIIIINAAPLKIDVGIANNGNIHVRPGGVISVRKKGLFLKKEQRRAIEIPLNSAGFPVLPGQGHVFEIRTKERLEPGRYGLELNIEFGEEELTGRREFRIDRSGKAKFLKK